jgi:hypothetical protein
VSTTVTSMQLPTLYVWYKYDNTKQFPVNFQYYSGMYATQTLYTWYKYDSMKQVPNSQLPITFTSNTGSSIVLDTYVFKRK